MRKICLLFFCICWLSACNTHETKTPGPETNSTQPAVLKGKSKRTLPADSAEINEQAMGPNQLIIPGKSIGLIKLNEQAEVVYKLLGKPSQADAAMGKMLATWFSEPKLSEPNREVQQTNIFFVRNMGSADESSRAKQIRITSPEFRLESGVGINTLWETIQAQFPGAKKTATYTIAKTRKTITVYHDKKAGIAFETDSAGRCVGISIQEPEKENFEVYTAFTSDFKRI